MHGATIKIFDDDVKNFRTINSVDRCVLLRSDIERTQGWCTANCMKLNSSKTALITFTGITNVFYYTYELWDPLITQTDTIKDLLVHLDSKLHFRAHIDYTFSPFRKDVGLNTQCNQLHFYSRQVINIALNST